MASGNKKIRGNYSSWLSQPPDEAEVPRTTDWRRKKRELEEAQAHQQQQMMNADNNIVPDPDEQQLNAPVMKDFVTNFFAELEGHDNDNFMHDNDGIQFVEHDLEIQVEPASDTGSDVAQCHKQSAENEDAIEDGVGEVHEQPNSDMDDDEDLDNDEEQNPVVSEEGDVHEQPIDDDESEPDQDDEEDLDGVSDDEQNNDDPAPEDNDEEPLYDGARVSFGTHMLLVMAFVVRHGLSGVAVLDLLTLIEIHCALHNLCKTSLRLFQKYFEANMYVPIQKHYYCANCTIYFGTESNEECVECGMRQDEKSPSYFLMSPVTTSLQSFFKRENFTDLLQYPSTRVKTNIDNLEDVYDGNLYKDRFENGFFTGTSEDRKAQEIHISFQMNTDGVALFKSSKYSVWPVFFVINELHPKLRYSREYRLLVGMWFGKQKPNFTTFMQPFGEMLNDIYDGVEVELPDGMKKTVRGLLLSAVFDSPARCLFQNFIQFNGKHGCPYCKQKGISVKTSERGQTQTYPFDINNVETGLGEVRTHLETLEHAEEAETRGEAVCGVKGHAVISFVPRFDIIRCVAPDYMHGVMLGIFRLFIELWFDVSHRCSKFSIRDKVKDVDNRLMNILPPNFISRPPQPIQTHIKWWKASEYRSFLLFYSVPCLYGILPFEYFDHLLLLVNAMHILLSTSISRQELQTAKRMLKLFVYNIKDLYHPRYYTWNMHSLLHYVTAVEDLGPLFLLSCFWYEDFNGDFRNMFHGTRGVGMQVLTAVGISQKIPILATRLGTGTLESELYDHMCIKSKFKRVKIGGVISEKASIIGSLREICQRYKAVITHKIGLVTDLMSFYCILFGGRVLQSKLYTRVTRRSNYTIQYVSAGRTCLGNVIVYIKYQHQCPNRTFCSKDCICRSGVSYAALVYPLDLAEFAFCELDHLDTGTKKYVIPVKETSRIEVVPIQDIVSQCVWMDVGFEECFVGLQPNTHEKD